ncbi:MAG: type II CAAX endopeptidase family protein [Candidatus Subteraquimicrobiales bacterium]|nr:type II CAAX endopeptidase family protein [Candidatus Subteraquimicrobiales bacterium]
MKDNERVPWQTKDVWLVVFGLIGLIILRVVFELIWKLFFLSSLGAISSMILAYFFLFVLVWYFGLRPYNASLVDLGFTPFKLSKALLYAFLGVLFIRAFLYNYTLFLSEALKIKPPALYKEMPELFGESLIGFLIAVLVVVIIAPVVEELFFRGFMYQAIKKQMGTSKAILFSSAIFALFHPQAWLLIPMMIMGIILAWLYEKFGSLGPPIILHALNNLVSVIIIYVYF